VSHIQWLCPSCEADRPNILKCKICDGLGFVTEKEYDWYLKSAIHNVSIPVLELDLSEFDTF
jgi:hypothetical protein